MSEPDQHGGTDTETEPGADPGVESGADSATEPGVGARGRWKQALRHLYFWVLAGLLAGVVVGLAAPSSAQTLKPLGDLFINAIKMLITPIVFFTIVLGITSASSLRKVGRVGLKALVYFEAVTTVALGLGMLLADTVRPGAGMDVSPKSLDASAVQGYADQPHGVAAFLTGLVPDSVLGAFADGDILQVLVFSVLFGIALVLVGSAGQPVTDLLGRLQQIFFRILRLVMYAAPVGAFGATAYTVGAFGGQTLGHLGLLMVCLFGACALFVFVLLGLVCRLLCGVSLLRLLRYFRQELLVVLATVSTETVLPQTMRKLERLGCGRSTVGITVPAGYSFNLDGAAIYLSMTSLFIAQAVGLDLPLGQQLVLLLVLVLTSKGGAGAAGAALAVLAATLSSTGTVPVAGIALILGIDRILDEGRALTNIIGNAVAAIVVSRWEKDFDAGRARSELAAGAREVTGTAAA